MDDFDPILCKYFRPFYTYMLQLRNILKHVSDWHGVPFWKNNTLCIYETCFRYKLCHAEGRQQYVFWTLCIWSSPTFITEKQTNKQTDRQTDKCSLALLLVSLHNSLMLQDLALTCGFDFDEDYAVPIWYKCTFIRTAHHACQSETCFRMAHVSNREVNKRLTAHPVN